jgi:hypothetical protein
MLRHAYRPVLIPVDSSQPQIYFKDHGICLDYRYFIQTMEGVLKFLNFRTPFF